MSRCRPLAADPHLQALTATTIAEIPVPGADAAVEVTGTS